MTACDRGAHEFVASQPTNTPAPSAIVSPTPTLIPTIGPNLKADINRDGVVTVQDVNIVKGQLGKSCSEIPPTPGVYCAGDTNCDGVVTTVDFNTVKLYYARSFPMPNSEPYCATPTP